MKFILNDRFRVFRIFGISLSFVGFVWFLLPIFMFAYGLGSIFGHFICAYIFLISAFYGKTKTKRTDFLMNVALAVLIVGMVWAIILSIKIITANFKSDPPKDSVLIVLGCQIKGDNPSLSLAQRLDVAYDYLEKNPETICIVTGGRGTDEIRTEASVEKEYLVKKGIDEERILLEDKSINTDENFEFSLDIINKNGLSKNVIVATQDFHVFRACSLASDHGLEPYPIAAHSTPLLLPLYYGRELLSITKYYLMNLI